MRDGELDRIDAREISRVQRVLTAGPRLRLLPKEPLQRLEHAVERRHVRQPGHAAACLQRLANLRIHQRVDDQPRPLQHLRQHAIEMPGGADHRPEMLDRLHPVELRDAGLGDRLQRLAGRIRKEMEVKTHAVTLRGSCGQAWGQR